MNLREFIFEELGNLAEFGEQESVTDNILKEIGKRIDEKISQYKNGTHNVFDEIERVKELEEVKEMLK